MPRKPRNSPRPPGRPRKTRPETVAAVAAGDLTPADGAAEDGVAVSTMQVAATRALQAADATPSSPKGQASGGGPPRVLVGLPGDSPASRLAQLDALRRGDVDEVLVPYGSPAPGSPPAAQAPPHVTEPSTADPDRRSALLALLAQALDARPALVADLPLDATELGRRLGDDGQDEPIPLDALEDPARLLRWVAEFVARDLRRLKPGQAAARKQAAGLLVTLASGQDRIQRARPVGESPEQIVQRRLVEAKDAAIDRIGILTAEATARLATARADFDGWAAQNLGPVLGAEVVRRVGLLFGEGQEVAA